MEYMISHLHDIAISVACWQYCYYLLCAWL